MNILKLDIFEQATLHVHLEDAIRHQRTFRVAFDGGFKVKTGEDMWTAPMGTDDANRPLVDIDPGLEDTAYIDGYDHDSVIPADYAAVAEQAYTEYRKTLPKATAHAINLHVEILDVPVLFDWWMNEYNEDRDLSVFDFNPIDVALESYFSGIGPSASCYHVTDTTGSAV